MGWPFLMALVVAANAPASSQVERAYDLVGAWTCQSAGGATSSMTFVRQSDGSVSMRNRFTNHGGPTSEFDEVYRFVTPAQYWSWTATLSGRPDFKEAANAGMWTAQKWFFDGTVTQRPHPQDTETHRIRMIYTWISDSSFEREFEIYELGVWKTTSTSVCRRTAANMSP
jgi:hypothetical protein